MSNTLTFYTSEDCRAHYETIEKFSTWKPNTSIPLMIFNLNDVFVDGKQLLVKQESGKIIQTLWPTAFTSTSIIDRNPPFKGVGVIRKEPTIIVGNIWSSTNYYHFLYQCWLPLLYLKNTLRRFREYKIIGPELLRTFSREFIKILDLSQYEERDENTTYLMEDVVFTNQCWTQAAFYPVLSSINKLPVSSSSSSSHLKIYISRLDSPTRELLNEKELIEAIKHYGYTAVTLSGLNITEQISLFKKATHIIAPHGAGLSNLIFSEDNIKIMELFPDTFYSLAYLNIANCKKMHYVAVVGKTIDEVTLKGRGSWQISIKTVCEAINNENF